MEQKMRAQGKSLFVAAEGSSECFIFYYNFETSYYRV